jgi:ketosteroid isomerase-like protein
MTHSYVQILTKFYADLEKGDLPAVLASCSERATFQIAGKSPLAGKYSVKDFATAYLSKLADLSGGTLKFEVHDILASERHGMVLSTSKFTRKDATHELRTVHVWRFEEGKLLAGYEYARDLYLSDSIWS